MEATPFARIVIRSTGNQKLPYFVSPCNVPLFFYARAARFTIDGLHDPADLPLLEGELCQRRGEQAVRLEGV